MKFRNLLLFGLCLCFELSIAQNTSPQISLSNGAYIPVCSYTEMKIPAQITGKFNSDNKFFIELVAPDYNTLIARYEAVYKSGNFVFTIGDNKPDAYKQLNYRVSSTSPVRQSDLIYSVSFYNRGEIFLARNAGEQDTLNAGLGFGVHFDMTTNNAVNITMNDSSVHEISSSYLFFIASKSTDLFIVKAVNSCNVAMPFSGKVSVKVNPISIIPVKINNTTLCEGSEIELSYGVTGGIIPESATFKLRFFKQSYSDINEKRTFEVTAKRKSDGLLTAKIPDDILRYSMSYQVAILVDGPKLLSPYSQPFLIYDKPVASFRSQSDSVRVGEVFQMNFDISGPQPYTIELNNGISYALDNNLNLNLYPTKTETYSIKSLKTLCGVTTDLPKQTVLATVPPGIAINFPVGQKWEICENQKLRLPFSTNVALNANTKFVVEGLTAKNTIYQLEAKIVNDSIEFFIPHSPTEWITEGYFSITNFRVKTTSPSYTSEYRYGFTIRGIPRVTYKTDNFRTLSNPQYYTYSLIVSGGVPFSMIDYMGKKTYSEYFEKIENIFVPASGTFGPKTIENSCYATSNIPKLDLTVNAYTSQTPIIVVHPPTQKYLCDPDSVEVSFEAFGKFNEGNEFRIMKWNNSGEAWLTVKAPGRYKLPSSAFTNQSYTFIQIRSTNPQIQGNASLPVIIDKKPTLTYPGELSGATAQNPRIFGVDDIPYIPTQLNSYSPYTAEYSDGTKNYHFEQWTQYDSFRPLLPRSKVTPYTLKSLTNTCGTTDINLTTYLYWKGHNLSLRYFTDNHVYCIGEEITVPFTVEKGSVPIGTKFYLQLKKGTEEFKNIASSSTGEDFKYIIPDSMEGEYDIRVISDTESDTGGKRIIVNKKPTATVSISSQNYNFSGEIGYGESVAIDYKLTGGGPWKMILSDMEELAVSEASLTQSYRILKKTQFQLQSVSNQCGYGPVSGNVSVKVKTQVISLKSESTNICSGNALKVKYLVAGDIPAGEKIGFYLSNVNGSRFVLQSATATSGTVSLPISSNIPGGNYELTCYITGSDISLSQQIVIDKAPDIELSGNTTINPGEFTYIHIRPKGEGDQMLRVTLSDGTFETFQLWGYLPVYSIKVSPASTTNYTIVSSESNCRTVESSGSAKVIVNPPSERTVRVTGLSKYGTFCEKDTILVYYTKSGTFSAGNQFTVQLSDNQGTLIKDLAGSGKESPLKVIIPAGFSVTEGYRIRIVATDINTASSDYQQTVWFGTKAGASFASSNVYKDKSGKARAVVLLSGTGPWRYSYGNDLGAINRYADFAPDTIPIASKEPAAYFKLLSVSNSCGTGTISEPSTIKVELILAAEEPVTDSGEISLGPNPTDGLVTLRFETNTKRKLTLYNLTGIPVWIQSNSEKEKVLNMEQYPSGIYLLKIENKERVQIFRIVKQ